MAIAAASKVSSKRFSTLRTHMISEGGIPEVDARDVGENEDHRHAGGKTFRTFEPADLRELGCVGSQWAEDEAGAREDRKQGREKGVDFHMLICIFRRKLFACATNRNKYLPTRQ